MMKYLLTIALIILAGCADKQAETKTPMPVNEKCEVGQPIIIITGQSNSLGYTLGIATNQSARAYTGIDHCVKQNGISGTRIDEWIANYYDDVLLPFVGDPVAAVVWIQGEADFRQAALVATYQDKLDTVLSWMYQDFSQAKIIVVETCPYGNRSIADQQDPDILTCHLNRADGVHYSPESQAIIGNLIGKEVSQ